MDTGIYSIKWFLQCFLDRIPFSLTLRVWDVFLLEGDNIILAMAFNILKLHQKHVLKLDMDQLMQFFQHSLTLDFGYEDDSVMESLKDCLSDLKSAKLLPSGDIPEIERPMKPFGEFRPELDDIEDNLERGARSAVSEDDRQFHRNTLQREEFNLRHIDSTDDIDEEDEDESDKSVSLAGDLSDSSVEKKDEVTPTKENINKHYNKLQDCIRELDKSFEYLMSQAEDISKTKTAQASEPYLRPSSAGPLSRSSPKPRNDVHKRSSAYIPQHVTNIAVRPGPSHIPRLVNNNSASSSSRDINLSSDSMGPDSGRNSRSSNPYKQQQPQHSKPPLAVSPSRTPTRAAGKNYYYFGDNVNNSRRQTPSPLTLTPEPKSRPRSRYFYGNTPDLTEILQTLGQEDKNDVALFDDVKTPVNDPPHLQERDQDSRLLTQEHNMKLLASAAASPSYHGPKSYNKERSHSSSSDHRTYGAVNKRFGATPVRSTSERQVSTLHSGP